VEPFEAIKCPIERCSNVGFYGRKLVVTLAFLVWHQGSSNCFIRDKNGTLLDVFAVWIQ
jgi:hypothetical protein